eukprot:9489352-Alexandrium_andersonii.AAC.1
MPLSRGFDAARGLLQACVVRKCSGPCRPEAARNCLKVGRPLETDHACKLRVFEGRHALASCSASRCKLQR